MVGTELIDYLKTTEHWPEIGEALRSGDINATLSRKAARAVLDARYAVGPQDIAALHECMGKTGTPEYIGKPLTVRLLTDEPEFGTDSARIVAIAAGSLVMP